MSLLYFHHVWWFSPPDSIDTDKAKMFSIPAPVSQYGILPKERSWSGKAEYALFLSLSVPKTDFT